MMKLLWITDPWSTLDHPKDTTLRLIEESLRLGVPSYWCDVKSIRWDVSQVKLDAFEVTDVQPSRDAHAFKMRPFRKNSPEAAPTDFTRLIYRTDPPVDLAFIHPVQLLDIALCDSKRSELVNPAQALLMANEKLEPTLLGPQFMPPSLASCRWEDLVRFGKKEGRTVLKPLHLAQSLGIELLNWRSKRDVVEAQVKLEKATQNFTHPVLLQRYLEGILEGEKRLWYLNGKLLAVVKKNPKRGEFKIDMDLGGFLSPTTLDRKDQYAAHAIAKRLKARKIRLAAVDLIEGLATDFNLTSPGLIAPMEPVLNENLAKPIIKSLCKKFSD